MTDTPVGTSSQFTAVIQNSGGADAEVTGVSLDNPDYTHDANVPFDVPAGGQSQFVLTFTPSSPGQSDVAATIDYHTK